ncbi:hypothetical protein K5X82_14550 [Halosquirtibacter xylanolyticus]|uniref:gliding motility lipoprotein GldB n=1 Tax=Halosquirtibacter xylanolyticus TaxID=3374599 RepID=UPI00374849DD|nr:hypothetical protein K5X82_14550 [Prolixibacteraceae bacterium]
MNIRSFYLLPLFLSTLCLSCATENRDVSTKGAKTVEQVVHIEKILSPQNRSIQNLNAFVQEDDEAAQFFATQVLGVNDLKSPDFINICQQFLSDSVVSKAYHSVDSLFNKKNDNDYFTSFRYFNHYFPAKPLPQIYTLVSGFNHSLVYNQTQIGVSLDKYLGANCKYYEMLGIPSYKRKQMKPERVAIDVMELWLRIQYPLSIKKRKLIDHIIYEGQILYALSYLFPDQELYYPIGFTKQQWEWCQNSEIGMWNYLVDQKLLFKSDPLLIRKMVGPAPFTNFFTPKSPGQCGRWIGYKIIQSYMKNHKNLSLEELLGRTNSSEILNESSYSPR